MSRYENHEPTRDRLMCGCDYCASVIDAYDDKMIAKEYKVAKWKGDKHAKKLNIGDQIQYYDIPREWSKVVYTNSIKNIQEYAISTHTAKIIDKKDKIIKLQYSDKIRELSFAHCFLFGMHKI